MKYLHNDKHKKARKLVAGAVSTFSKAIEEVEKATELLVQAVEQDITKIQGIESKIVQLYAEIDIIQSSMLSKESEIAGNKELVERLKQFSK